MPTPTYTPLANITLASSATQVVFSSIGQGYRDLILVINGTYPSGQMPWTIKCQFNNDTGANYPTVEMYGSGSSTNSSSATNNEIHLSYTQAVDVNTIAHIMDYSATDKHKTVLSRGSSAGYRVEARAGRWANTAAITSMKIFPEMNNFPAGMTLALYGVAA